MGKHEPMTAKAIANKIKAKGLQKIKYYCEMCKKQCRDDNGFKCHIMSEAHQRQALIVSENPERFVSEFSRQFMEGFMHILKARYRTKRILANTVFQDYIKEKDHVHLNGTRWTSLTEFANWLGENGHVKVEDSERGVMITYIDKDPETLRRQELDAKRAQQAKQAAERNQKEIERQMQITQQVLKNSEREDLPIEPVTIVQVPVEEDEKKSDLREETHLDTQIQKPNVIERPVFEVQAMTVKSTSSSSYKPPKPKRLVSMKSSGIRKKSKTHDN